MDNTIMTLDSNFPKRISYILATKNRESYLKKVFLMIQKLKKKDDEFIIIDGGSSDGSIFTILQYRKLVDMVISEPDVSEGHAYNKGILLAQGRYIKLLTDDDEIFPKAMERAVEVLDKSPFVDILLCGGTKNMNGKEEVKYLPYGVNYGKSIQDIFTYGGCGIGLVIRHTVFAKVGLLNAQAFALDIDFLAQSISRGAVVKFSRLHLYYHSIYKHSGVMKQLKRWVADERRIKKQYGLIKSPLQAIKNYIFALFTNRQQHIDRLNTKIEYVQKPKKYKWDGGFS